MLSCIARAGGRPSMCLPRSPCGWKRSAQASSRQDEDRLLQGQQPSRRARAHLVHVPRVRLPATAGEEQGRRDLHGVPARYQPRDAQGQKRRPPRAADTPAHQPVAERPSPMAEPHRRRVDALLRTVLPDRDRPPPTARQCLPDALGRKEVSATTTIPPKVPAMVDRTARSTARPLRPLEMGPQLRLTNRRMRRAR